MANLRTEKNGTPTQLTAPDVGRAVHRRGGYAVTGTPKAITYTAPASRR